MKTGKFCTKCGVKINTAVETKSSENDSNASTKSFDDYFYLKRNKKTGFFKRKEQKITRDENPTSKKLTSNFFI